jgi:hypothetical protein
MNILARRNCHSGRLKTGIPDAGNHLNSAWVQLTCIAAICKALAA